MTPQTKSDLTRQTILQAGQNLIVKYGFGGVGLARILQDCNVPKGSFYYYFRSKDDFGQALLSDYVSTYLTRFDALVAGSDRAGDKLDRFWAAWLTQADAEGIASRCLVVKLAAEVADLSDSMRVVLNDGIDHLVERIAALLQQGALDGSIRAVEDADATARMLYAKWLGAAILAKLDRSQKPLELARLETQTLLAPHHT